MNKEANFPADPQTTLLLALLTGAGGYGLGRGIKNVSNKLNPPQPPQDELTIDIPHQRLGKQADFFNTDQELHSTSFKNLFPHLLALTAGVPAGFYGASKLYSGIKDKQLETEKGDTEKEYLKTLSQINHKMASEKTETPLVDMFCAGLLTKAADLNLGQRISDATGFGAKSLGDSETFGPALAAWALSTLGFGAGTYALGKKLDAAKEENKAKTTLPTHVRLNPV